MLSRVSILVGLCALAPAGARLAAQDEALELGDLRQRISYERRLRQLERKRIRVDFDTAPMDVVARRLGRLIGTPILPSRGVVAAVRSGELKALSLRWPRGPARAALAAVRRRAGVLFVHGRRFLRMVLPAEFRPRLSLRLYGVQELTFPLRDFIPPAQIGLRGSNDEQPSAPEPLTRPASGFDEEALAELVRKETGAGVWEVEGTAIDTARGLLIVRQSPRVHYAIERLLGHLR